MGIRYRKEDEADKWLREHDPYYSDKSGHKSKKKRILTIRLGWNELKQK